VNRINDPNLPQYRYGNNARNNLIGPPLVDVDFSVAKSWKFKETRGLEFRSEFFNLLNHPIFAQPGTTCCSAGGGIRRHHRNPHRLAGNPVRSEAQLLADLHGPACVSLMVHAATKISPISARKSKQAETQEGL